MNNIRSVFLLAVVALVQGAGSLRANDGTARSIIRGSEAPKYGLKAGDYNMIQIPDGASDGPQATYPVSIPMTVKSTGTESFALAVPVWDEKGVPNYREVEILKGVNGGVLITYTVSESRGLFTVVYSGGLTETGMQGRYYVIRPHATDQEQGRFSLIPISQ